MREVRELRKTVAQAAMTSILTMAISLAIVAAIGAATAIIKF